METFWGGTVMALDRRMALMEHFGPVPFLTDGGLETHLVFADGLDLPQFAAFPLLRTDAGRQALTRYFAGFLDEAEALNMGFVLDTPTWRASAGWGARMGWTAEDIDAVNREAVEFAVALRQGRQGEVLVNGVVGPHGDAYRPETVFTADEAEDYHRRQVRVLAEAGVDLVTAVTISSTGEAIGIARAARAAGVPVVLSFTVETDGRLVGGTSLAKAIAETDAATGTYAAWFGVNCAHPDHFAAELSGEHSGRIGMVRANASRLSHGELDEALVLDAGDPLEMSLDYVRLRQMVPGLRVLGGCCGTDLAHVAAIGQRFCLRE